MAAVEGSILPLEMLQEIFSYLEVQEIEKSVAPVCRLWRDASRLPVVRRRLTLNKYTISPSAAHAMLRRSPQLKELKISDVYEYSIAYTNDVLRAAAMHNQKLRVLEICDAVSAIGLQAVAQCDQLRTLTLSNMARVTDDGVVHLAQLNLLEKLQLWGAYNVTAAGWHRLFSVCEWPHLRELSLWLCEEDEDEEPQVHFERLPTSLRSIYLCGSASDVELEAVAQCDQLRTLMLCYTPGITGDGVLHLARLRHLEKLEIIGENSVTPDGWRRLFSVCEWPHLRELSLSLHREVAQVHFERLHTTLRSIVLDGGVSDVDLEAVAQCAQLRTLSLGDYRYSSCDITDDGVVHLARLRHLETLKIWNAKSVTAAGWRRLFSVCEWPHLRALSLSFRGVREGDRDDLSRQAKLLCPDFTCSDNFIWC